MIDKLNKALRIARKSGDKVIVVDSADPGSDAFMVMSLEDYEEIIANKSEKDAVGDLTEQQLIDKINRDIALWKSENPPKEIDEEEAGIMNERTEEERVEENMYYYPDKDFLRVYKSLDDDDEESDEEDYEGEDMIGAEAEKQTKEEKEENLFEKFAREEERQREKSSGWEIPFDVKKNADEIQ